MKLLAALAVRRPVAVTVVAVTFVVLGWVAWGRLPLDLLPDVSSPTVLVSVRSGDRPPLEMERLYGEVVEQRLFTVRGIRAVDQVARSGRLVVRVTFDWDANVDLAVVDVQKAVGPIAADPAVDEVVVRRFDPRQLPILALGLVADEGVLDLAELRLLARRQLAPALEQLEGVAEVRVVGGREREVRVLLDRARMEAHAITVGEVEARLRAANVDVNAGTLEDGDRVYLVRGMARFGGVGDVARAVVRYLPEAGGTVVPVHVGDLAEVVMADAELTNLVRVDGVEGVGLEVYKEAGANTVAVARTVRSALEGLTADLGGVAMRVVSDESALVEDAIADVESAALIGILLAVAVLVVFLRAAAPTVVVAAAVPVSLLTAVFAMHLVGESLNLLTLGGLALGAGMLVDNAIVVVEAVFRRRAAGDDPATAAAVGAGEVGSAIAASTVTTCVVFLPVLFVRGLAAKLVAGLAFSVVVSLVASLAVAVFLIPALAAWLLPRREVRGLDLGQAAVERLVARLLTRPFTVVAVAALVTGGAIVALARLGTELLPPEDPRQLGLRLSGPPGQRVEATARAVEVVEGLIAAAAGDDLAAMMAEVGRLPDDDRLIREEQSEESTAVIRVRLHPGGRTGGELAALLAPTLAELGGHEVSWQLGSTALARALGSGGPPIAVEVAGRSLADLRSGAAAVARAMIARPELWNVRSSFEDGPPELRVALDRAVADGLGVDLDTVATVLQAALDGREATVLTLGDEERRVMLRLGGVDPADLAAVPFTTAAGQHFTLGEVASFTPVEGAREIYRRDQRRVARVTAQLAPGVAFPAAPAPPRGAGAARAPAARRPARRGGGGGGRERAFAELGWAGLLAILLVLMVLAATFESLLHPFTVLAAVPLSLVGVAAILVPIGHPLGVMAVLGLIVLAGVAVNDSILLVDAARALQAAGLDRRTALARAAAVRLRPILMTTATTVLALVPLAFGGGAAAALRAPLAQVVIGGVTASLVASLVVIPCLYELLDRLVAGRQGS